MGESVSERASLWRESLRDLRTFTEAEWKWIAVLAGIFAIERLLPFLNYDPREVAEQFKKASTLIETLEIIKGDLPNFIRSSLVNAATIAVSTYVFTVLYFQRFTRESAPVFSFLNFLHWLKNIFLKYGRLIWPIFLVATGYIAAIALTPSKEGQNVVTAVFSILGLFWAFYYYYGIYLYFLVSPLAVLRKEPALKTSAQLTGRKLWRLWWGTVVVYAVIFLLFLPLNIVGTAVSLAQGAGSPMARALMAVMGGACSVLLCAAIAVYACVVYRIFSQEQSAAGRN